MLCSCTLSMFRHLHQSHRCWLLIVLCSLYSVTSSPVEISSDDDILSPDPVLAHSLHVTDIHSDPEYLSNSDPKSQCHRNSPRAQDNVAGEYGTLGSRCDSPVKLTDQAFKFMKQAFHDVDFVIYTGDSARHDRDPERSRKTSDVMKDHSRILSYFSESFDLNHTLVVPTIGNNDVLKHNIIAEGVNEKLYKKLLDLWAGYKGLEILVPGQAQTSFLKGGYWIQSLPRVPNLKIINLNSMFFYIANKDQTGCDDRQSPGSVQLDWYEQALKDIAKNTQKAYVMGHIPPKDEHGREILLDKCYGRFVDITGKHAYVISGIFWGHTNVDTLSFISKTHDIKPTYSFTSLANRKDATMPKGEIIAIMTTGPSILPFNHPAIRSYRYDPSSSDLLGYTQYYANLTDANHGLSKGLVFKEEYNTWKDYRLPALTLKYWKNFFARLVRDKALWKRYLYHKNVGVISH
ncbi:hypothetical protein DSO57_1037381 [Entomophthora muscae]|uniref:Uncharacterized protein n=1 Tax=Entomophthora muscae TaxID=34485 RepID=A0ACC2S151_9FUNG|nr:hypothetical protein DSO57_1037381 [Entomophthora muscae]